MVPASFLVVIDKFVESELNDSERLLEGVVVDNLILTLTQCNEVYSTAGSGLVGDITSQCQYDKGNKRQ
jgi:hypothetical protein